MKPVTVATFDRRVDAEPIKEKLVEAGLDPVVSEEAKIQTFWMPHKRAHIKLRVPEAQLNRAEALLDNWRQHGMRDKAVRCPDCCSSRVQFPQGTRKFMIPSLLALICSGFRRRYYCQDCHRTWPDRGYPSFDLFSPKLAPIRPE